MCCCLLFDVGFEIRVTKRAEVLNDKEAKENVNGGEIQQTTLRFWPEKSDHMNKVTPRSSEQSGVCHAIGLHTSSLRRKSMGPDFSGRLGKGWWGGGGWTMRVLIQGCIRVHLGERYLVDLDGNIYCRRHGNPVANPVARLAAPGRWPCSRSTFYYALLLVASDQHVHCMQRLMVCTR